MEKKSGLWEERGSKQMDIVKTLYPKGDFFDGYTAKIVEECNEIQDDKERAKKRVELWGAAIIDHGGAPPYIIGAAGIEARRGGYGIFTNMPSPCGRFSGVFKL